MSQFTITAKTISSKIDVKGLRALTENIRYPFFECEDESKKDVCTEINRFYSYVAGKYSNYARHGLTKKIAKRPSRFTLPVNLTMNYMSINFSDNITSVVIDLCFSENGKIRMRRFSQIWDTNSAKILRAGSLFNLTIENKKTISQYIRSEAEKFSQTTTDSFDSITERVKKYFCFNNCFLVPNGVSFFFDAGILRPEKYGPCCFVMPFSQLDGILNIPLTPSNGEKDSDL